MVGLLVELVGMLKGAAEDSDSDDEAGKPSLGRTQLDQVKSVALKLEFKYRPYDPETETTSLQSPVVGPLDLSKLGVVTPHVPLIRFRKASLEQQQTEHQHTAVASAAVFEALSI